jgi:hypothetical protein
MRRSASTSRRYVFSPSSHSSPCLDGRQSLTRLEIDFVTQAIAFVNPPVFEMPPQLDESDQGGRCCLAPHYYDGLTLL